VAPPFSDGIDDAKDITGFCSQTMNDRFTCMRSLDSSMLAPSAKQSLWIENERAS
jgi:hypothetical protein